MNEMFNERYTCLVLGGCTWSQGGCTCLVWGVYLPGPGGVYLPGPGGVPAWSGGCTCLVPGGCTCLVRGGVPAWSGEVYLPGLGGGGCTWSGISPPVDRMTHAYENITLPQTSFAGGNNIIGLF